MKKKAEVMSVIIAISMLSGLHGQDAHEIISLYEGSSVRYDDPVGFEALAFAVSESAVQTVEGNLRRLFCRAPEGRSPLEIIRNYEKAVEDRGGAILFVTRDPKSIEIDGVKFTDLFGQHRMDRGLSTSHYTHTSFPGEVTEYLAGKFRTDEKDVYLLVAAGKGAWAASEDKHTFYELVILEAEPMEMGMVTAAMLGEGLSVQGRVAIYGIHFDTGQSDIREESADALKVIAEFINADQTGKYLVVGHTDNTGDFDRNIRLSSDRAKAVADRLVSEYGVDAGRLRSFGIGPASPVLSNVTEEGRAKNRRVEIVRL